MANPQKKGKKGTSTTIKARAVVTNIMIKITSTSNNTNVVITDMKGNVLGWSTAGKCGFNGARQGTPYAGQMAAQDVCDRVKKMHKSKHAQVRVSGVGSAREAAIRVIGEFFEVSAISDCTPIPFNGCRPKKETRG